ncbi:MAG: DinB family protein [bacterium]
MPTRINTRDFTDTLPALMSELTRGSPDHATPTYMLNRGDEGLLRSLERLSASAASVGVNGGSSIAGHVDHVRYGLSLLNRWAAGDRTVWKDADWTTAWQTQTVSDADWQRLRDDLRREVDAWIAALGTEREVFTEELRWMTGSIAHFAYHLGAIRQIDRSTRGPTADEDRTRTRGST